MAIQKTVTTEHGFNCNAYMVVEDVAHYKKGAAQGRLFFFKDKDSRDAGKTPFYIWNFAFAYDLSSELNIVTQAYLAIKNNPEYANCQDV
jgi:hypothetical protein